MDDGTIWCIGMEFMVLLVFLVIVIIASFCICIGVKTGQLLFDKYMYAH